MIWLLLGIVLLIPFEQSPTLRLGDTFLGFIPGFTAIKALGAIAVAAAARKVAAGEVQLNLLDTRTIKALFVYLAIVLVAAIIEGATARATTRLFGVLLFLPVILVAIQDENDLRKVLRACPIVMLLGVAQACLEHYRFGGAFGDIHYERNYFALNLVLVTPLAFAAARQSGSGAIHRVLWYAATAILLAATIWTGSRAGFLALMLTTVVLSLRTARRPLLTATAAAICLAVLTMALPTPTGQRLLATLPSKALLDPEVGRSTDAHLDLLYSGLEMIRANPISGVGLGRFEEMSTVYYNVAKNRTAHNSYLHIAAESGLPALAAFGITLATIFLSLLHSGRIALKRGRADLYQSSVAISAGMAGFLFASATLSTHYDKLFWLLAFASVAMERMLEDRNTGKSVGVGAAFEASGHLETTTWTRA